MTIDPRAIPAMLHWYEGMLLLPEHFQAAARRQEMLGGYLSRIAAPHGWGVQTLEQHIADGKLVVTALDAVMPDGLVVRYRSTDADDAPPLEADLTAKQHRLEERHRPIVHLVVIKWNESDLAQEGSASGGLARYRSVRGEPLGGADSDVAAADMASEAMRERPWLHPILKLHVGDGGMHPPPARYVGLPIARVMKTADAAIALDPQYEPPRTEIGRRGPLHDTARTVAAELRNKAVFLSERLRGEQGRTSNGGKAAEPSVNTQLRLLNRRFQMLQRNVENLQALARTVPRLEGLIGDGHAHPFTLYLTLCDIVGDLAMLGGELNLPTVPSYEHRDPLASLDVLEAHIFRMLQSLNQRFQVLEFERKDEHRFELTFRPDDFGARFIVGAVRAKGDAASNVVNWMKNATISTEGKLTDDQRRRDPVPRRQIERDEDLDLTAPTLTTLFEVDARKEHIDRSDRTLVIQNTDADGPMSILLYLPRGDADHDGGAPDRSTQRRDGQDRARTAAQP